MTFEKGTVAEYVIQAYEKAIRGWPPPEKLAGRLYEQLYDVLTEEGVKALLRIVKSYHIQRTYIKSPGRDRGQGVRELFEAATWSAVNKLANEFEAALCEEEKRLAENPDQLFREEYEQIYKAVKREKGTPSNPT